MRASRWQVGGLAAAILLALPAPAPAAEPSAPPRGPTDVFIRQKAGLPAESARGNIEIVDVGHSAFSTMLSIVATRTPHGWHVSYACAESDWCTADRSADHRALDYDLAPDRSARLDTMLDVLAQTVDPGGMAPSPTMMCGYLNMRIDLPGLQRDFSRACNWGKQLGAIEQLIAPPVS